MHARADHSCLVCLMILAVALCLPVAAFADDYAEVHQLLRSGKPAEALARTDQYLINTPRDPQMRFLKGVAQTELGRTAEAITTFISLTENYPELPEPYNNLAVLYAAQSQFDKARAALEMAIRTNPSYATAHENLGDVYAKLASQAYSKALQLDTNNAAVQPKLALIRELFSSGGRAGAKPPAAAPASVPASTPAASAAVAKVQPTALATAPIQVKPAASAVAVVQPRVAPASSVATAMAAPSAANSAAKEVEAVVHGWAAAWSAKDLGSYLGAYGKEFDPPGKQSRKAWEDERRARITGKSHISVKIADLSVAVTDDKAIAKFKQAYSADGLNISSRKMLELQKSGDRWVIVKESNRA